MMKRFAAFTLPELLVSLSVLGLIAALTLPSIFNSVNASREKAIFKEALNALSNVAYQYAIEDGALADSEAIMDARLAYQDKREPISGIFNYHLATGAYIGNFNHVNSAWDTVVIDLNGDAGPNAIGQDIIWVTACFYGNGCTDLSAYNGSANNRPGEILPMTHSGYGGATNVARYRELLGLS